MLFSFSDAVKSSQYTTNAAMAAPIKKIGLVSNAYPISINAVLAALIPPVKVLKSNRPMFAPKPLAALATPSKSKLIKRSPSNCALLLKPSNALPAFARTASDASLIRSFTSPARIDNS